MTETNLIKLNTAVSAEIAQHIAAFKASGGKIQRIKRGVSGGPTRSYNNQKVKK